MSSTLESAAPLRPTGVFSHEAFFYEDLNDFVAAMTVFLREGIAADEPTLVVLDPSKIAALRSALGHDAEAVGFADMRRIGGNPGRIIPVWQDFVTRSGLSRPLRGIGEPVWPDRSADELSECHQHEALLNLALENTPLRLVCPYDAQLLPQFVLDGARQTHPHVLDSDTVVASDGFQPLDPHAPLDGSLTEPPQAVLELLVGVSDLGEMRRFVVEHALASGLDTDRADDLTIAVNELATNSILHGSGIATLRCWTADGSVIHEVHDGGFIDEPLVGRRFPSAALDDGRGLWLVNQLCDLVQLRSSPVGTTVRVHMRREGPAPSD